MKVKQRKGMDKEQRKGDEKKRIERREGNEEESDSQR